MSINKRYSGAGTDRNHATNRTFTNNRQRPSEPPTPRGDKPSRGVQMGATQPEKKRPALRYGLDKKKADQNRYGVISETDEAMHGSHHTLPDMDADSLDGGDRYEDAEGKGGRNRVHYDDYDAERHDAKRRSYDAGKETHRDRDKGHSYRETGESYDTKDDDAYDNDQKKYNAMDEEPNRGINDKQQDYDVIYVEEEKRGDKQEDYDVRNFEDERRDDVYDDRNDEGTTEGGYGTVGADVNRNDDDREMRNDDDVNQDDDSQSTYRYDRLFLSEEEMLDQSAAELKATVEELEKRFDAIENEGNEWKTRFETQEEMNQQLERQIILLQNKVEEARRNLREATKTPRDNRNYDDMSDANPQMIKAFDREKNLLANQLRDLEWRLDQESKAYHKANDERKQYVLEINAAKGTINEYKNRQKMLDVSPSSHQGSSPRTHRDPAGNIPNDHRIIDPKKGPIRKTAGVKNLPSLEA
ncbi:uncharacterized protein [Littorina saxatilis]